MGLVILEASIRRGLPIIACPAGETGRTGMFYVKGQASPSSPPPPSNIPPI